MKNLVDEIIKPFLEIERKDMPQVTGKDLPEMLAIFEENDISYRTGNVSISQLNPTQEDFKPDKVKGMVADLKSNKMVLFPIVISEDGYIMDGHHRWLAAKELYGEDSKIPAITIQMPKDKALLMFAKTSDKLNETIKENPDRVRDEDGYQVTSYEDDTAFPFGYNYQGDMYVGNPGTYHNRIADFYSKFDSDAYDFAPESRHDMEYPGRIWPEEKLISFWKYPDSDDLLRVLKDVEKELNRIHDEYPDIAEEYDIPLIKIDSSWKIDVYKREDRERVGDADTDTDTDTDDKKVPKDPNQLSLGLTKNIVPRDTDRIAGRGNWDSDSDIWSTDYEDEEEEETGTQIPIDQYTGQTEKEKARAAAQAQAIQHVLPPGDPRKEKRIAPPKRKRAGMTPTQYHQWVCTSEGKTLADFLIKSLLNESDKLNEDPDAIYDKDGDTIAGYDSSNVFPFGYDLDDDKIRIGNLESPHWKMDKFYGSFGEYAPDDREDFGYAGRVFIDEKIISFWEYPEPDELENVLNDIEQEIKRINKEYPDVPSEYNIPSVKFDKSWKLDIFDQDELEDSQIPIGDYTGQTEKEKEIAKAKAQAIQHVLPPGDPRKEKRIASPKRKRAGMTPTQYKQFICTSEGKTLADFLAKSLLNENPDMIYNKDGNEILHHSEGGVPFGYYQGKMHVGVQNTHHGQMKDLYPNLPGFEDTGWKEFDSKEIWGRFWPEQKMISFWKHPEDPEELKNVLSDIATEVRKGEVPIKFDNSWMVDVGETENPETFEIKGKQRSVGDYSKELSYKQFICTTEGENFLKSIITEDVILEFLVDRDIKKLLTEITPAQGAEVDDGPATFYKNFAHYKSDVDPVAEQMGFIVLDYLISKLEDEPDFVNKVDYRYNIVPVTSYGSSGVGHTRADNPVAKYRDHISVSAENIGFEIIDFLGVDLYDVQGVSVEIPHQFKRDKMLLKYKKGETFADDTLEESIKKKINGIEFEFKYNEHEVEPFFTVLRDGVPVDRMPANLSKEEMIAFTQKNFSKWMADYVKSYGGFFTQIPQQGQTHGVYTGMESKENLIDINVFLD